MARWYLWAWTMMLMAHPVLHAERPLAHHTLGGPVAQTATDTSDSDSCPVCSLNHVPGHSSGATIASLRLTPVVTVVAVSTAPTPSATTTRSGRSPPPTPLG